MQDLLANGVMLRYDEIALKGANRNVFEKCLQNNIKHLLKPLGIACTHHSVRGRMWFTKTDLSSFAPDEFSRVCHVLNRAFGLASYSPMIFIAPKWETIKPLMIEKTTACLESALSKHLGTVSFCLRVRRADKRFPIQSRACEIEIVESLPETLDRSRLKIDLKHAQYEIGLEIREKVAFIWFETLPGPGGLPVGANENVLTLLSGGIDSPVAAWRLMKRGCHSDFITFDSYPYTPVESIDKVKRLARELCKWQGSSTLYICNIVELQKIIRDHCDSRFRTVLYRRMMMRISTAVAKIFNYGALVTGEAVGQVASQTITNINTIGEASGLEILRPLCGMDKSETMRKALEINTLRISEEQFPDSCTVFAPESPATKAKLWQILEEEKQLGDIEQLVQCVVKNLVRYYPLTDTTKGVENVPY